MSYIYEKYNFDYEKRIIKEPKNILFGKINDGNSNF